MAVTEYTWNPLTDSVIEETDGAGTVMATYTNEPQPFGALVSQNRGGVTNQYHYDALGSTRLITNSLQLPTDQYTFDAWGNSVTTIGTTVNPFQ